METTRMTTKGQVVIPAEIRRDLKLSPGTELAVSVEHGRVILEPKSGTATSLADWKGYNPRGVHLSTRDLCTPVTLSNDDRA